MKKTLLTLASIMAVAAPIATVLSCSLKFSHKKETTPTLKDPKGALSAGKPGSKTDTSLPASTIGSSIQRTKDAPTGTLGQGVSGSVTDASLLGPSHSTHGAVLTKDAPTGTLGNVSGGQGHTALSSSKDIKAPVTHGPKISPITSSTDWIKQIKAIDTRDPWSLQTKPLVSGGSSVPWVVQTKPTDPREDWTKQTKAIDTRASWSTQAKATVVAPKAPVVHNSIPSTTKDLSTFNITSIKEDQKIDGFLADVTDVPREMRVYDNGLFKIKIDKGLIGVGKYFASNAKADMEAHEIAKCLSIGPAITHLPKGIQLLQSNKPASLGGPDGVQVSESNQYGSADDNGIRNEAALVAHEYGHHETLWDFQNILGGTSMDNTQAGVPSLREVMVKGLKDAGYDSISDLVSKSSEAKQGTFAFMPSVDSDFPTDYGKVVAGAHKILNNYDYPFCAAEIATRALNILSFRTDLNAHELYTPGLSGMYPSGGAKTVCFEPPTVFITDASMRHFAKDSVFGEGKDNSRIDKLIDFYENDIFGLGKGQITLVGDPNGAGKVTGINIDGFGILDNLDSIELIDDNGKTVGTAKATSFNSRMGFKDELITNKWSKTLNKRVNHISLTGDFENIGTRYFQIIAKDINGDPVDISSLHIANMKNEDGDDWINKKGLVADRDHFYFNLLQ